MKGIALVTIIYIFSVAIPIQGRETVYVLNYDNFGSILFQGDGGNDFHINKYADIDTIFDEKYEGSNVGGAFLVQGGYTYPVQFTDYVVNITATFYCGSTYAEQKENSLYIGVGAPYGVYGDGVFPCQERGWHYNYTWIPPRPEYYLAFFLYIEASQVTINKAYGFDELRIITSDTLPQLLQLDSNDP